MRLDSSPTRHRNATPISASTAGAIFALMAIAMTVSAQGATAVGLPEALAGSRPIMRDTSAAREFAAAVTAAVRNLVGHDTIDGSAAFECTVPLLSAPSDEFATPGVTDIGRSHAPQLAQRLLNIPPPQN